MKAILAIHAGLIVEPVNSGLCSARCARVSGTNVCCRRHPSRRTVEAEGGALNAGPWARGLGRGALGAGPWARDAVHATAAATAALIQATLVQSSHLCRRRGQMSVSLTLPIANVFSRCLRHAPLSTMSSHQRAHDHSARLLNITTHSPKPFQPHLYASMPRPDPSPFLSRRRPDRGT